MFNNVNLITVFAAAALCAAPVVAHASAELDKRYALENIGAIRAWDNVDGLFADYVSEAYRDYFSSQSRFILQDLSKADNVLSRSKVPYHKLIEDSQVLGQLARSTRSETLIRTKVYKEGPQYRFVLDWLLSPQMELIASEQFTIGETADSKGLGDVKIALKEGLARLLAKVPFVAHVTGRDNNSVTLNVGANAGIKKGDILVISTLDEVKKHPLLKSIVDWQMSRVGKLTVENVDDALTFAKVSDEEPGRKIARYQKVTQVIPAPADQVEVSKEAGAKNDLETDEPPKLGWISGGIDMGGGSRDYSTSSAGREGSGLAFGATAAGQLWLNRTLFVDADVRFGSWSQSQTDLTGTASTASPTGISFKSYQGDLAYSFLAGRDFFSPRGWLKLGYRSTSYTMDTNAAELAGNISWKGLVAGVGGDMPIRGQYGATFNVDFGLFTSVTDSVELAGDANEASDFSISLAGYYRYTQRITFRVGLNILGQSAQFASGSATQKITTISPAILYYF